MSKEPKDPKPHKIVTRTPNPKQSRAEKKYERLTGRNPRLGIVRSPSPRKGK